MTKVWIMQYQFDSWEEDDWCFLGVFSDPEPAKQLVQDQNPRAYNWDWKRSIWNESPMWKTSCKEIVFSKTMILNFRLIEQEIDQLLKG